MAHSVFSELTVSSLPWPNMPGPGNTGCRLPESSLKSPYGQPWWEPDDKTPSSAYFGTILSSTPSGTIITGYKFQHVSIASGVSGLTFRDCVFDANMYGNYRYSPSGDGGNTYITGATLIDFDRDYGKPPRNITLDYCTLRRGYRATRCTNNYVGLFKTIKNCAVTDMHSHWYAIFDNFHHETSAVIKDNWFARLGRQDTGYSSAKSLIDISKNYGGHCGSGFIFSGNYVDTGSDWLYRSDNKAYTETNTYAPQWDPCAEDCCPEASHVPVGAYALNSIFYDVADYYSNTYLCNIDVSGNWFQGWSDGASATSDSAFIKYGTWNSAGTQNRTWRFGQNKFGRDFTGDFSAISNNGIVNGSVSVDFSQQEWMDGGTLTLASEWAGAPGTTGQSFSDYSRYLCAKVYYTCDTDLWDWAKEADYFCNGNDCPSL